MKILVIISFIFLTYAQEELGKSKEPPFINVKVNQTSSGKFVIHYPGDKPNVNKLVSLTSLWMQDDLLKKLYISIGEQDYGDKICSAKFWFIGPKTYEMQFLNSNCDNAQCDCISDFGYAEETDHYNSTYLGYIGRFKSNRYNIDEIDLFTGRMVDGVGPMTNTMVIGVKDKSYRGMITHETEQITDGSEGVAYYREYIYDKVKMKRPDQKYFVIPDICLQTEKLQGCRSYYGNKQEKKTGSVFLGNFSKISKFLKDYIQN